MGCTCGTVLLGLGLGPPADPGIWERGGITYCFFRTAASLKTRASPKKADKQGGGGGGGLRHFFFRSAIYVRGGGVSSNRGIAGRNQTPFFFFFFFSFKRGGTCTKRGGIYRKMFQKGGHGPAVPPPLNPPLPRPILLEPLWVMSLARIAFGQVP